MIMGTNIMQRRRSMLERRGKRGVVMLEALVAALIFAFGVLGVVGLHAQMTKISTGGKMRADAIYLANEVVGRMWSDQANVTRYGANCAGYARCNEWLDKVGNVLPGGTAVLAVDAAFNATVTINWTMQDSLMSYSMTASVNH
jgi:type IV pilus assembly protein PilV